MRYVGLAASVFLLLSCPTLGELTTRPSASTRPARTGPPERELSEQEKKALNAALLEARKARIPGAESLQRDIENSLAAAERRYKETSAVALKNLKRAQGDGDRARAAAARQGRAYDDHRNTDSRVRARAAKDARERLRDNYEEEHGRLADDLQKLKAIELAYTSARETQVFLKFDQLKKANVAYKRATATMRKIIEMPNYHSFGFEFPNLAAVARAECSKIRMPVEAETNDAIESGSYDENPEHSEQFKAAEKQRRVIPFLTSPVRGDGL